MDDEYETRRLSKPIQQVQKTNERKSCSRENAQKTKLIVATRQSTTMLPKGKIKTLNFFSKNN